MYHFTNHQLYHQNSYQQQCPLFVDHSKHHNHTTIAGESSINQFEVVQHSSVSVQPDISEAQIALQTLPINTEKKRKVTNKTSVDTSSFSIEERLVAAVWVHERKSTKNSMSQIKQDFRQRFGREPPTKNTLLVWERKLFATGSVHDAPRTGRPVNRRSHMESVSASLRAAPALSLRARARALRLPRTTLRTILRTDLRQDTPHLHSTQKQMDTGHKTVTGKLQTKKSVPRPARRKIEAYSELGDMSTTLGRVTAPSDHYT